ncbi:hypothetical protein FOL46_003363 [Perkinsus olseni]|uniref:ABC transporter domain-containing protein n=2 Tax=Perkinsus olseni TaxID=32597 RepID=A0A7J6M2Y7_PEROL|nr:hypothetical protein FOL46_003363 [Perkinsus olseni]
MSNGGYCPIGGKCNNPEYCAEGSIFEQANQAGVCRSCGLDVVKAGYYCANGTSSICPPGFFCPIAGTSGPIPCPEGYFCKQGFQEPVSCPWFSQCPRGATNQIPTWGAIFIIVVIGIIVAAFSIWLWLYRRNKEKNATSQGAAHQRTTEIYNSVVQALTGVYLQSQRMQGFTNDIKYTPVDIRFEHLSMTLKWGTRRQILQDVTGEFPAGSLSAVMGPSGGGKTTFMNALSNRAPYGDVTGKVWVNGFEGNFGEYPKQLGFVPQDDIMFDRLTVYQNLYYSAMVRLPEDMPREKKLKIIEDVIQVLDLEQVRHTIVGSPGRRGISGGQKKRVNIGIELVAYPRVLFLDEPTSGLDSAASMAVTKCLARMRTLGITVVCVIHQPRYAIFRQFTHCLLLGKGGRTVYIGKTSQAEDYFVSHGFRIPRGENVADWFIDIISGGVDHHLPDGSVDRDFKKEDLFEYWTDYQAQQAENPQDARPVPSFSRTVSVRSLGATNSENSGIFQSQDELRNRLCELLDAEPDEDLTPQQIYRLARLFEIECDLSEARELYRVLKAEQGEVTCESFAAMIHGGATEQVHLESRQVLPDLSRLKDRQIATVGQQLGHFLSRNVALISLGQVFLDLCLNFLAAVIIGTTVQRTNGYDMMANNNMMGLMFFAIMIGSGSLQVYGFEFLAFERDASAGTSVLAYWGSKTLCHLLDTFLFTLIFTATWVLIIQANYNGAYGYCIFFVFAWWVTGFGQLMTVVFPFAISLLLAVIVPVEFVTMFGGVSPPVTSDGFFQKAATYFGCGYYATELLTMAEFTALPSNILDLDDVAETVHNLKYGTSYYVLRDFCVLFGMGLIWRLLTLAWLQIIVKYRRDGLDSMVPWLARLIDYFNGKFNPVVKDARSHDGKEIEEEKSSSGNDLTSSLSSDSSDSQSDTTEASTAQPGTERISYAV